MDEDGIRLHDFVKHIREELLMIRADPAAQKDPLMHLNKLDLSVQVKIVAGLQAGFKFWIVNAGSELKGEQLHTIKLVFEPPAFEGTSSAKGGGGGGSTLKIPLE